MMSQNSRGAVLLLAALAAGAFADADVTSARSASLTPPPARTHGYVDAQLRSVVNGVSPGADWLSGEQEAVAAQVCATTKDMKIGVARRPLSASERRRCDEAGRRSLFQKKIGAIIVAPVSQPGAFIELSTRQLFEALAADDAQGRQNRRASWKDIDPSLPDATIRLLLPAPGSPEDSALTTALMRACLAHRTHAAGASAAERIASCAKMRSDASVARAAPDQSASAWLASSGAGALALVGYGQLASDPALTGIVPLDGVLPQADMRMRGEYPASMTIYFIASHPGRAALDHRDRAAPVADAVLAEGAIGPYGRAAQAGLAPLPPAERVTLRQDFARFLQKGGVWE